MNPHFRIALFVIAYSLFLILVSAPSVHAEITRTLQIGSTGPDVKELQIILNSDPLTTVSSSGTGSPGKESEYFGILTKKAVEAFQKKYAPEVLFPAGIWQPTGIVGAYSRNKLNSIGQSSVVLKSPAEVSVPPTVKSAIPNPASNSAVSSTISSTPSIYTLFATKGKPLIFNLSRYQAKHGDTVSVQGSGFLQSGNSIVFSASNRIDNLSSANGTMISFTIPDSVQNGSYNLSVENKNGSSYSETYGNFFTVTETPSSPPKATSVFPTTLIYDAKSVITISGTGFSSTGNDVFTNFGQATNISSSDGTTLRVELSAFSAFSQSGLYASVLKKSKVSVPISVVVKNSAGISSDKVSFLLQY